MHTHPPDPDILAHCVALVVANNQPDTEALMRLAHKLRFGDIAAWSPTLGHAPFSHRLVFFLVHFDFGDADRLALLKNLRHSGSVSLCYAPVVMFLRDASEEQVRACVEMGFDEVINVPAEGKGMATRLAGQIGREHLYVETRNYLGPDRHRLDHRADKPAQRQAEEPHARLIIRRTVEEGVHIVRREGVPKGH
ncbi:hypothetical protein [Devosia beringensis]|uniref:hypothetical protein n=1 Tax=Devosia beringensis TaxID=2657486 RepID=UPI00186B95A5|nr:hypothetical protein [Devosia beringensis]